MTPDPSQNHSALSWVRQELDLSLQHAREQLEAYAQDEVDSLSEFLIHLHQVQGTLALIEVYGGAMLAGEMEVLGQALNDGKVSAKQSAAEVLMLGIVRLSAYMEHVESGGSDSPLTLLPVLNDLRASRDAPLVSEMALFAPQLDAQFAAVEVLPGSGNPDLAQLMREQRPLYHKGLLKWFRGRKVKSGLHQMRSVLQTLLAQAHTPQLQRLLRAGLALIATLLDKSVAPSAAVKQLFGHLDRVFRQILAHGEEAAARNLPVELLKNMLFYVARSESSEPAVEQIRHDEDLANTFPDLSDYAAESSSEEGADPGKALYEAVSQALKVDLRDIKDQLDLYMRGDRSNFERLANVELPIRRVGDTLGMVGRGELRARLLPHCDYLADAVNDGVAPSDSQLMAIASDLLYVESASTELRRSQAHEDASVEMDASQIMSEAEFREHLQAALCQAGVEIAQVKECLLRYLSSDPPDPSVLSSTPGMVKQVSGALVVMEKASLAELLERLAGYFDDLVEARRASPDPTERDALADLLSGVELQMESVLRARPGHEHVVEAAYAAAQVLNLPGLSETGEASPVETLSEAPASAVLDPILEDVVAPDSPSETVPESDADQASEVVEIAAETPESADLEADQETSILSTLVDDEGSLDSPSEPSANAEPEQTVDSIEPLAGQPPSDQAPLETEAPSAESDGMPNSTFSSTVDDIDSEIRGIFLEEAAEEIAAIQEHYPIWRQDNTQQESLTRTRRAFHTLKGSGRLVGAMVIGEFAWSIENLLNRVIDESVPVSEPLMVLLEDAISVLPGMLDPLAHTPAPIAQVEQIQQQAFDFAEGKAPANLAVQAPELAEVPEDDDIASILATDLLLESEEVVFEDISALIPEASSLPDTDERGDEHTLADESGENRTQAGEWSLMVPDGSVPDVSADDVSAEEVPVQYPEVVQDSVTEESFEPQPTPVQGYDQAPEAGHPEEQEAFAQQPIEQGDSDPIEQGDSDPTDEPMQPAELAESDQGSPADSTVESVEAMVPEQPAEDPEAPSAADSQAAGAESDLLVTDSTDLLEDWSDESSEQDSLLDSQAKYDADSGSQLLLDSEDLIAPSSDFAPTEVAAEEGVEAVEIDLELHSELVAEDQDDMPESVLAPDDAQPPIELESGLCSVFTTESMTHLGTIESFIDNCRGVPDGCEYSEQLARAFHTLRGSAHMAEVREIAELAAAFESWVNLNLELVQRTDQVGIDLLERGHYVLAGLIGAINQTGSDLPSWEPLVDEVSKQNSLLHQQVEATGPREAPPTVVDPELLEIFLEEANELSDGMEQAFVTWSADANDLQPVGELQRYLHTIKGAARMAGLLPIGDLAHAMESLFESLVEDRVQPSQMKVELARHALDAIETQVEAVQATGDVPAKPQIIERLEAAARNEESTQWEPETSAEQLLVDPEEVSSDSRMSLLGEESLQIDSSIIAAEDPMHESGNDTFIRDSQLLTDSELLEEAGGDPSSTLLNENFDFGSSQLIDNSRVIKFPGRRQDAEGEAVRRPPPLEDDEAKPSISQERVRVRSALLDQMVNNAGEVNIYRARLEQQNKTQSFNLVELTQTIDRLRSQLRSLEMETEAQILSRHEREGEAQDAVDFDPLELDRYSTIQQLSRALSETVDDLGNIGVALQDLNRDSETLLLQQARVNNDLQDGLLRTRMVPVASRTSRLQRVVRQTAQSLGKRAELEVIGGQGEMDRAILERMLAPLEHLLRNAVAHGIESPEQRTAADKPETGVVSLVMGREGADVVLTVSDDGRGFDRVAIRAKAIERGLLDEDAEISDDDLDRYIQQPGFSTAGDVSQVAGRGVGMDVVISEIKQLGGTLDSASLPGRGSSFTIRLPFTLAITEALLVTVGEEVYAVPHGSVDGIVRIPRAELEDCYLGKQDSFVYGDRDYAVRYLGGMLGNARPQLAESARWFPLLLVRSGEHRVAIQVDALLGNRQIVVKSVGAQLSSVRWFTGGTILADGQIALILDVNSLVRMDTSQPIPYLLEEAEQAETQEGVTVMVVDDSITVRKVTTRLLERHNMNVVTAKDGVDAVTVLQEQRPDVMLLDIEMPRMDGFELARHMRSSEDLKEIPIIMITSRTGDKHRSHAMDLGVRRYLGKPYQESELLDNIYTVLAEAPVD